MQKNGTNLFDQNYSSSIVSDKPIKSNIGQEVWSDLIRAHEEK